ncbi:hypothetical protein PENTCL1PPCAC_5939, partial [Pristionchus entomophagus]
IFDKAREIHDEEHRRHLEDISKIHLKRMQQEEDFFRALTILHEKRTAEREKIHEKIMAANRHSYDATVNIIKSRR